VLHHFPLANFLVGLELLLEGGQHPVAEERDNQADEAQIGRLLVTLFAALEEVEDKYSQCYR
jgi:hypothetical protein